MRRFLLQWERVTSNKFVLDIIKDGYALEFHRSLPTKYLVTRPGEGLCFTAADRGTCGSKQTRERFLLASVCNKETVREIQVNPKPPTLECIRSIQKIQNGIYLFNRKSSTEGCLYGNSRPKRCLSAYSYRRIFLRYLHLAMQITENVYHFQYKALLFVQLRGYLPRC